MAIHPQKLNSINSEHKYTKKNLCDHKNLGTNLQLCKNCQWRLCTCFSMVGQRGQHWYGQVLQSKGTVLLLRGQK